MRVVEEMSDVAKSVMLAVSYIRDHRARETVRIKCVQCAMSKSNKNCRLMISRAGNYQEDYGRTRCVSKGCIRTEYFLEILPWNKLLLARIYSHYARYGVQLASSPSDIVLNAFNNGHVPIDAANGFLRVHTSLLRRFPGIIAFSFQMISISERVGDKFLLYRMRVN